MACQAVTRKCGEELRCTHIVLSELIDGDLSLHEVVVEDNDFPAEGSLFLFMVLGLQYRGRENGTRKRRTIG